MFCLTDEGGVVPAEISLARVSLANGVEEVSLNSQIQICTKIAVAGLS